MGKVIDFCSKTREEQLPFGATPPPKRDIRAGRRADEAYIDAFLSWLSSKPIYVPPDDLTDFIDAARGFLHTANDHAMLDRHFCWLYARPFGLAPTFFGINLYEIRSVLRDAIKRRDPVLLVPLLTWAAAVAIVVSTIANR